MKYSRMAELDIGDKIATGSVSNNGYHLITRFNRAVGLRPGTLYGNILVGTKVVL